MKISTKGRYGLRAMVDLAAHASKNHVSLISIAERQNISLNYLEQVFASLRKAGMVRSIKGAGGGYLLNADPKTTSIYDILRILEGEYCIIDGSIAYEKMDSVREAAKKLIWDRINDNVICYLKSITLAELAEEYINKNSQSDTMYFI